MTSPEMSIRINGVQPWDTPDGEIGRGMTLRTTRGPIRSIVHHE